MKDCVIVVIKIQLLVLINIPSIPGIVNIPNYTFINIIIHYMMLLPEKPFASHSDSYKGPQKYSVSGIQLFP